MLLTTIFTQIILNLTIFPVNYEISQEMKLVRFEETE